MVQRVVGYDDKGKEVFNREAREYDKSISNAVFGITIKEVILIVPVITACVMFYANNETFKKTQGEFNTQMLASVSENAKAIGGMKDVMSNLNNYLSSTTGRQFKDGRPISYDRVERFNQNS